MTITSTVTSSSDTIFHVADRWGTEATDIFNDPEPNHSSTGVRAECFGDGTGGRCRTIPLFQERLRDDANSTIDQNNPSTVQ
jgi:hypothetical protein